MANPLRKTMVYLGLADEDYDDHVPAAPVAPVTAAPGRAAVTPLRRPAASTKHAAPGMNEILTVNPRQYKDVQAIAEAFREGVPVIMNLSQMPEPDARRLIDFASGLASGLYGKIERVTNKVFLLSPEHVAVSGEAEETETEVDAGFLGTEFSGFRRPTPRSTLGRSGRALYAGTLAPFDGGRDVDFVIERGRAVAGELTSNT